jgi:ABC-type lipoprotein release transport system permease subunit
VLASIASMLVNLPIIYRQLRDRRLLRTLTFFSVGVALLGVAVLVGIRVGAYFSILF